MTKEEIIALIDSAIAGQGNQVDAGSVLDKVLKGVIGLIQGVAEGAPKVYDVDDIEDVPQDILNAVKPGDVVREVETTPYIVGYKNDNSLLLININATEVTVHTYAMDDEWILDDTEKLNWNVQADWNVANANSPAFIRNKPTIPQGALIIEGSYTGGDNPYIVVDSTTTIKNAMEQGRAVFIQCSIDGEEIYASVIFGSGANCYTITEGKICTIHD